MSAAKITITLNPAEFDLLREGLTNEADRDRMIATNHDPASRADASVRAAAREHEARIRALLAKLA